MKKIKRIWNRTEERVVSLLLAMLLILTSIFTSMLNAGYRPAFAEEDPDFGTGDGNSSFEEGGEELIIRDDALHFIFRHWHTNWDNEATLQGARKEQYDADTNRYFVIVEGYIIPHTESETGGNDKNAYTIVLVDQQTGELKKASDLYEDHVADGNYGNVDEIKLTKPQTPYLGEMNKTTGSIELKVKPLADSYWANGKEIREVTEKYCGVSLSAGRGASTLEENKETHEVDTIRIKYSTDMHTHIVKGHIFYSSWTKTVTGSDDSRIIGNSPETDTAEVYTWITDDPHEYIYNNEKISFEHNAGDIVAYTGSEGEYKLEHSESAGSNILKKGDENILKELGLSVTATKEGGGEVKLTTFYSSIVGLHTNKTLVQSADGRYFLFDLEAWYIEGYAAQLGYVIDASGSMAGTSDVPSIINIYVATANRIGVLFSETDGLYRYTHNDSDVTPAVHTHTLKTCSMPYFEFENSRGETTIIQATKITNADTGEVIDRTKIESFKPNLEYLEEDEAKDYTTLPEVEYENFTEQYWVTVGEGKKAEEIKIEEFWSRNSGKLEYVSTYYIPTDEEQRIDMQKFLVAGDRYTPSTSKHVVKDEAGNAVTDEAGNIKYYCWAGLVKEFGKKEVCDTIAETIGNGYEFTPEKWDEITGLKGKAGQIKFSYPQRESMIGYYEITNNSGSGDYSYYRRWYFNSIAPFSSGGARKYIAPGTNYTKYATEEYFARAVRQGKSDENGDNFDFTDSQAIIKNADFAELGFDANDTTGWGNLPANFVGNNTSFNLGGGSAGATGFMLSKASTPTGDFTISFDIQETGTSSWSGNVEILYIGSKTGNIGEADFRLVREKSDLVLYYGKDKEILIENYKTTTKQTLTFTYDKGTQTVTFYVGNDSKKTVTGVKFNNGIDCIVFDPFYDVEYNSNNKFEVDEIFVYDTVLTKKEVGTLLDEHNKKTDINKYTSVTDDKWEGIFLSPEQLNLFMNPNNTAHVPLGVAAYNYFVYDGTSEFYPLAYWNGQKATTVKKDSKNNHKAADGTDAIFAKTTENDDSPFLGEMRNFDDKRKPDERAGWYFLSHRSDNDILMDVGTAKVLTAMNGESITDMVVMNFDLEKSGWDVYNSGRSYTSTSGDTIPFYIDANGNLRCFFSNGVKNTSGGNNTKCSYVYELDDKKYVKTEALQRILAYFSAELSEKSPSSQISAVQFSNANRKLEDLVLLDWSSKADDIAAILSQKYGIDKGNKNSVNPDGSEGGEQGAASGWKNSDGGVTQHNFALTGGTATDTGLKSFFENVVTRKMTISYNKDKDEITYYDSNKNVVSLDNIKANAKYRRDNPNPDVPKFVIIFTDGADDNFNKNIKDKDNPAYPYAKALKDLDYTVIGMYIPAGSDPRNDGGSLSTDDGAVYAKAQAFLGSIVSTDDAGKPYVFASTDLLAVANIFDKKIIGSINGIMSGYTLQDYIDPRFDLQTADGTVWHLGAAGKVTIESAKIGDGSGTVTLENSKGDRWSYTADGRTYTLPWRLNEKLGAVFHLVGENTNGAARDAYLRYDSSNDMYYLVWENQTIQSSPIGSTYMMPVWSVEYWLVAKDDFMGGNAVLTSGNEKNMNYVYHHADKSADAYAKYVFDSWAALSSSLRGEYDSHWKEIYKNRNGTAAEKNTYNTYMDMWDQLTKAGQDGVVGQWNEKYDTHHDRDYFSAGKEEKANGARIMYMIVQMNLKRTNEYDASSGVTDREKTDPEKMDLNKEEDTVLAADGKTRVKKIDEFPSKGFPRIAVNVSPNSVYEDGLISIVYLGEVMSPVLVLNNMVNNNPTNWYLNYLARYAYYLYPNEPIPLLKLLEQWDGIEAKPDKDGIDVKSFSVPYMYLPNYQYNTNGDVIPVKLNNAGVSKEHSEDVLGLLTYHWKLVEGDADVEPSVVNDVDDMDPWQKMKYKLTVEYTVFREGDTYESIIDQLKDLPDGEKVAIFDAQLIDGTKFEDFEYSRSVYLEDLVTEKNVYAAKVWSVGTKDTADEADAGSSEESDEGSVDKNMVTVAALMQLMDVDEEKAEEIVSAQIDHFYNDDRTQQVLFKYQPNVVGAELALELRITAEEEEWEALALSSKTITVTATRTFKDNAYAEKLKNGGVAGVDALADYASKFTIEFSITKPEDATPDNGVYTVYAKAKVKGTFGDGSEMTLSALPIGSYEFGEKAVDMSKVSSLKMSSFGFEMDVNKFNANYFNKNSDLFGTTENPNDVTDNIAHTSSNTIYFGIKTNGISNYNTRDIGGESWIRDHDSRIAIIDISTSITPYAHIVIVESGGNANESFLYRITDRNGNELIVSVKGGGSTTIYVPFGTYTVKEISDWSWRYEDGAAQATLGEWTINQSNAKVAEIEVNTSETRIVTYVHEPNYKGWLGGENYSKDFLFGDSHENETLKHFEII